ncbi:hypothetical protein FRB97_000147 [Tulasnella sp. 331]|nr:hypothetical protein FRB97_000147 [Tulasnella sp. 331]
MPLANIKELDMPATEYSPLIDGHPNGPPTGSKFKNFILARDEPGWLDSYKFLLLDSWMNILLVCIPFSFAAHHLNWDAGLVFLFSFFAIIPLAKLLGESTEQLSMKLGQTLGGLLNASFGNAVEVIVGIAALIQGELRIVQTSMLGSILSNLLLVLGMSFFAGGLRYQESHFQQTAAQTSSSLMTLACLTLVIPAAYHTAKAAGQEPFNPKTGAVLPTDVLASLLKGLPPIYVISTRFGQQPNAFYLFFQLKSHADLFKDENDTEEEIPGMSMVAATFALLGVTLITSFCADFLVSSIEETANKYSIPKAFIGVILLPLVSNAAEHVTSVWMALKGKMELTIGIAVGSSIQIAVFVIPTLILIGWAIGQPLTLYFADFETVVLFVSVLLVNLLIQDGKSNYMEGMMLMSLYIIIALAFWVS